MEVSVISAYKILNHNISLTKTMNGIHVGIGTIFLVECLDPLNKQDVSLENCKSIAIEYMKTNFCTGKGIGFSSS